MIDVCLILEGTYPYRVGGVSTWTHALITGLPDISFSVVHLYAGEAPSAEKFSRPPNLKSVCNLLLEPDPIAANVAELVTHLPEARLYHDLSTGFAGLLGAAANQWYEVPFIITEHGIYWREAEQDGGEVECGMPVPKVGELGRSRASIFREHARHAYAAANAVVTVCEPNRELQLSLGAVPNKCMVISNGVEIPSESQSSHTGSKGDFRVGLVGRITPLKDVKTFLRACRAVKDNSPQAKFFVIGPEDHSLGYYAECLRLVEELDLPDVTFTGEVDVNDWYPKLDIVVLTSISEAQPLALLEAMAHGRPVVATDVGGCRDLVEGRCDAFGPAGVVCAPGDVASIASAIIEIGHTSDQRFSHAGRRRATAFHTQQVVLDSYRRLYEQYLCAA